MRAGLALLACLALSACATASEHGPPPAVDQPRVSPPRPQPPAPMPQPRLMPVTELPGWAREDFGGALRAFAKTCAVVRDRALADACLRARSVGEPDAAGARAFFETTFVAERRGDEGVLTAYFAPVYEARQAPDTEFSAPVRARPDDLTVADGGIVLQVKADGTAEPYPDRAVIEAWPAGQPLAWMRPEELFFLQVQGSGVLTFEGGRRMKVIYAAHNGRPFAGIANPMRDRGLLARDNTGGDAIRGWLAAHRGPEANAIMQLNPRYVFFRLVPDDGKPPAGAANLPLPAGRAVAIDPAFHTYGDLLWIDGEAPLLAGAFPAYRRLVSALDTGGAIKGEVRADLYLGEGDAAGTEAGRVRHTLRLYRLVPR